MFKGVGMQGKSRQVSQSACWMRPVWISFWSQFPYSNCQVIFLALYYPATTAFGILFSLAAGPPACTPGNGVGPEQKQQGELGFGGLRVSLYLIHTHIICLLFGVSELTSREHSAWQTRSTGDESLLSFLAKLWYLKLPRSLSCCLEGLGKRSRSPGLVGFWGFSCRDESVSMGKGDKDEMKL